MPIHHGLRFLSVFACAITLADAETYIIPQVADGGGWKTTLAITNTTSSAATAVLTCYKDTSGGATTSWSLSFQESGSATGFSIPAAITSYLHTMGTASSVSVGWCELRADAGLEAYAVFTSTGSSTIYEGTAVAAGAGSRSLVPFDNTDYVTTSMAIVNYGSSSATVLVGIHTSDGSITQTTLGSLPANGHLAFETPSKFSVTSGKRGLVEFYSSTGLVSAIALRFTSRGSFTSAPTYTATGSPIIASSSSSSSVVKSLALSSNSVAAGATVVGTVTLSAAAPTSGAVVSLTSSNTVAAAVPNSVTVAAGSTTATFVVAAANVSSTQSTTIAATYGGSSASASLSVTVPTSGKTVSFSRLICYMNYQPTGLSAGTVSIDAAPFSDNTTLLGSVESSYMYGTVKGYSTDGGTSFVFNQIAAPSYLVISSGTYLATSISFSFSLSNLAKMGSGTLAGVSGSMTVTGTPYNFTGSATTLSGPVSGSSNYACVVTY